jgi:SAM-dependent methyltransferase
MEDPIEGTKATISPRKRRILEHAERMAPERGRWIRRNRFFHDVETSYLRFIIPPGQRILELGCGTGELLAALDPAQGVGIDLSESAIAEGRHRHPSLDLRSGDIEYATTLEGLQGPFDFILLADTIGDLEDVETLLGRLHALCGPDTRIVIVYHSPFWAPVLKLAEWLGLKMPATEKNWLWPEDIGSLLSLADFEPIRTELRILSPRGMLGLGNLVNMFVATLPAIRRLCLRNYIVAQSLPRRREDAPSSVSIVIPARNEEGNIAAAVARMPRFADDMEILFVEGNSADGTWAEMLRVRDANPGWDIKCLRQDGKGKGDAVRKGFAAARGDVLMILDADLTVPPEDLPKFWRALALGKGDFVNGSRLVYPMQDGAMQALNFIANHGFSIIFTYLLNQRFTDTLCGTKVLRRRHYLAIERNRSYFGDFDPFGDFDLIFGAVKQNLKVVEVPIRYAARTYGETQISRFRHGVLLLRMVLFAYRKLKAL